MTSSLKVGSTVWVFDQNRRVYPPSPEGRLWSGTGPIYREHWVERKIIGEERTRWILNTHEAFPKKNRGTLITYAKGGFSGNRVALSLQEVEDDCWAKDKRHHIVRAVERCDVDALRQIATLLGMDLEAAEKEKGNG